jgi:hypothetical protein
MPGICPDSPVVICGFDRKPSRSGSGSVVDVTYASVPGQGYFYGAVD